MAEVKDSYRFKRVDRGPQKGAPPSLEFVALDRLQVDPTYQRATDGPKSAALLNRMVREWNWALCQPLVVARRLDGSLWILDGQHRHSGAKRRGDIAHLPCVVLPGIDLGDEAKAFVDLNTQRQRLSQSDIFHGMLASGDADAKATFELLEETGWRLVRGNNLASWKPGDFQSGPMVANNLRVHGDDAVRNALLTLRQAYPNETITAPARLIGALIQVFRPGSRYIGTRPELVRAMAPISAAAWLPRAQKYRADFPKASVQDGLIAVILDAAGLCRIVKPTQPAPSARPMAPGSEKGSRFFIGAGDDPKAEPQAWCTQCEKRRTHAQASACDSQFCKLKGA